MDTSTPQTGPSVKRSSPLINRNFALLWVGQGISNVGDTLFDTTLILWIATQLAGRFSWAPLAVSGVLLAVMIPTVLLGPVAGAFVDRWDKRRTMIWMDGIRAGLIVLLVPLTGLVPGMGSVPVGWQLTSIYAVVLLATTCSLFFGPSR
ncbi:MAG TPA: MFS transporter, partial [Chloroflexota bacterium]